MFKECYSKTDLIKLMFQKDYIYKRLCFKQHIPTKYIHSENVIYKEKYLYITGVPSWKTFL